MNVQSLAAAVKAKDFSYCLFTRAFVDCAENLLHKVACIVTNAAEWLTPGIVQSELTSLSLKLVIVFPVGVCMCGFCNVWVSVCVGFVMCGCVYVWVL